MPLPVTAFVALSPLPTTSGSLRPASSSPVCALCRSSSGPGVVAAAAAAAAILSVTALQPVAAGVISVEQCFSGTGPGCDAADASPIVKELIAKSKENKEKNEREMLEKYWDEGYKSYFSFGYDRILTKQDDGTYTLERPESMIANGLRALGVDVPTHGGVKISRDGSEGR